MSAGVWLDASPDRHLCACVYTKKKKKNVSLSVWLRQQYGALLIATLISFIIKHGLCVWWCADCWGKKRGMEAGWFQRLPSGSREGGEDGIHPLLLISCQWFITLCPLLVARRRRVIVILHRARIAQEFTGCLLGSDWGKNLHACGCWTIKIILTSPWV